MDYNGHQCSVLIVNESKISCFKGNVRKTNKDFFVLISDKMLLGRMFFLSPFILLFCFFKSIASLLDHCQPISFELHSPFLSGTIGII